MWAYVEMSSPQSIEITLLSPSILNIKSPPVRTVQFRILCGTACDCRDTCYTTRYWRALRGAFQFNLRHSVESIDVLLVVQESVSSGSYYFVSCVQYKHIHTRTRTHTPTHIYTHMRTQQHMCIRTRTCAHTHAHTDA